mgnify:CR=1 FL=1
MELVDDPVWSFDSLRAINSQDRFTHFDYVRVLRQAGKIDSRTLAQWLKSFVPPLVEHSGRLYLSEQFSAAELVDVRRRVQDDSEAQLFMNLVNISDLLAEEADTQAESIASLIAQNLNAIIGVRYPSHLDRADTLVEDDEHYVSVVRTGA